MSFDVDPDFNLKVNIHCTVMHLMELGMELGMDFAMVCLLRFKA